MARAGDAENHVRALQLRRAGATYDQIANQLGYADRSGAYRAVRRALDEAVHEPAGESLNLELERLDALMLGLWGKASKGDVKAVDAVLRIMDRRSRVRFEAAALPVSDESDPVDELQARREHRRKGA